MSELSARPHALAGLRRWLIRPRRSSPTMVLLAGLVFVLVLVGLLALRM